MRQPKCCKDRLVMGTWKGEVQIRTAGAWCEIAEIKLLNIDPQLLIQRLGPSGRIWSFEEAVSTLRWCPANKPPKGDVIPHKTLWESFIFWEGGQERYEHQTHG